MDNSKRGSIPMQVDLHLSKSQCATTSAEMKRMQNVPYASAVGSIMYAVRCTRPDVAFAQNITSRFQQNSGEAHWTAVKNILKYLRNTKDTFLVYGGNPEAELRVNCYCDAGFETDRDDTKSQTSYPGDMSPGIKRNVHVELNWTKRSIFYELEYWSFLSLRHNLDIMHIEKNVLEAILNTLLMNDKSKDTAKARQDLQMLGIRSGLWLGQTKNGKCLKPQAAYSFTPENRKKFCQYIKGVKLPDGFGSCFKHKVTDNDTNITGLKSHDCHIMMQRLLPYGLQNYLPDKIAKPIIDLCSLFKQICSATLMEDDMLKAQIKVVDILCELELIYPPALFDIMVHLVIHLPIEALEGGPIRLWWMYPFERYMKKLKGYVRNKAKPEGSIAKGYVAKEALTFSSHYFRDVTMKFNRPDRNVDPPSCNVSVSGVSIGIPEIDTYRSQFKSLFPNKDMQEEFPDWFGSQIRQRHIDNDHPEVSTTSELFALANGPSWTPISVNSCVVDGVRYVVHSRDERRTTQDRDICSSGPDGEMYYDGHHTVVDAPPDIIDVPDEEDDIIGDEDALPYDLADSDVEDLINVDDDGVEKMSHEGDGGGDDRPPSHVVPTGCEGCFANKGKGVVPLLLPLGRRSRGAEAAIISESGPCLTSGRTWIPPAGQRSTKASTST
ncbi:reverse transcriptase domain-containing protein [Tanacetum coccineum]